MVIRLNTPWLVGISDEGILDITVQSRARGEKIALWQKTKEKLVVLFDGKVGNEWRDYTDQTATIAPGAYIVLDCHSPPSMIMANVAGVTLDAPHHTLSYFYQARWGGEYWQKAKRFNKAQAEVKMEFLWGLYAAMNLSWYQAAPEMEKVHTWYTVFNDHIMKNVHGMTVHVPLILDPENLVSMH